MLFLNNLSDIQFIFMYLVVCLVVPIQHFLTSLQSIAGAQLLIDFIPASNLISLAETISVLLLVRCTVLSTSATDEKSLLDFHIFFLYICFIAEQHTTIHSVFVDFVLTYRASRTVCFLTICLLDILQRISFDTGFYIIESQVLIISSLHHRSQYYGR